MATSLVVSRPVRAQAVQTQVHGFSDRQNSYAWAMASFKGKIYVGTNRNFLCVERATLQFYFPNETYYTPYPDPLVPCTPDPYDLNLQAEIWSFTPETNSWTRVFQSPADLPNPRAAGKYVARDIGFRDMVVYTEPDGTQALYAAGVTAREHIPGLPPPRILRSVDGITWAPIPQNPGTALATISAVGFRTLKVYNGRMYVIASTGLTGNGVVLESARPFEGNNSFRQVTPAGLEAFELEVFNNQLYIGTGDLNAGYSVLRTNTRGKLPYTLTPVVTSGAGRGSAMTSVVSMHVFKGRLYVGGSGWLSSLWPTSELIRIAPDDSWDVVVGESRFTSSGFKWPVSGLPDGFMNPFNWHFWRMQADQDALYLGTNDGTWGLRLTPFLDPFINHEYGFDLFATTEGVFWGLITRDGFGTDSDFGARTMSSTPAGLFGGTANHADGTAVLFGASSSSATTATSLSTAQTVSATLDATADGSRLASATASTEPGSQFGGSSTRVSASAPQPPASRKGPGRLVTERHSGGTLLSWDAPESGGEIRVYRADYVPVPLLGPVRIPWSGGGYMPPGGSAKLPANLQVPSAFREIGTTTQSYFVDGTATDDASHVYYVEAIGAAGGTPEASNLMFGPSRIPPATTGRVSTVLLQLAGRGKINLSVDWQALLALLQQGRAAIESGDTNALVAILTSLVQLVTSSTSLFTDPLAAEDVEILVSQVLRRAKLARAGVLPLSSLR